MDNFSSEYLGANHWEAGSIKPGPLGNRSSSIEEHYPVNLHPQMEHQATLVNKYGLPSSSCLSAQSSSSHFPQCDTQNDCVYNYKSCYGNKHVSTYSNCIYQCDNTAKISAQSNGYGMLQDGYHTTEGVSMDFAYSVSSEIQHFESQVSPQSGYSTDCSESSQHGHILRNCLESDRKKCANAFDAPSCKYSTMQNMTGFQDYHPSHPTQGMWDTIKGIDSCSMFSEKQYFMDHAIQSADKDHMECFEKVTSSSDKVCGKTNLMNSDFNHLSVRFCLSCEQHRCREMLKYVKHNILALPQKKNIHAPNVVVGVHGHTEITASPPTSGARV